MPERCEARAYPAGSTVTMRPLADGWPLRWFDWPGEGRRGSLLFLCGRGDFFEKYLETFAHWHAAGWHVTSVDWRGQSLSGRLSRDPRVGHVKRFADWIDDLGDVWQQWREGVHGPHVIIGHSMGGHLALRALIEARIDPVAAVLSAPMLGFDTGLVPGWMAAWIARRLAALGPLDRPAWKANEKPGSAGASRASLLTSDPQRYDDELWWGETKPELMLGPPSWQWLLEAHGSTVAMAAPGVPERVTMPVFTVGTDGDKLVSAKAIRQICARLPGGELMMFDKSVAHEVLRERDDVRSAALSAIDTFLDKVAPNKVVW